MSCRRAPPHARIALDLGITSVVVIDVAALAFYSGIIVRTQPRRGNKKAKTDEFGQVYVIFSPQCSDHRQLCILALSQYLYIYISITRVGLSGLCFACYHLRDV